MYSLYLDRPVEFVCEISVKNASLKNAMARMIVKTDNLTLLFEGQIKDGKCIIPIGRLKGLLEETFVRGAAFVDPSCNRKKSRLPRVSALV